MPEVGSKCFTEESISEAILRIVRIELYNLELFLKGGITTTPPPKGYQK
jgi:hypothetical protein